ncbi:MAG: hypothetical protein ABSB24_02935 [Gaiellaceae bacterium]|jgi:integrase
MPRKRTRDPRLHLDPPGYEGPRGNKDGSVSYYHRFKVDGDPRVETIRSDYGADDSHANARAKAWADYDAYRKAKEDSTLDERRELRREAKRLISQKLVQWFESEQTQWDKTTRSNYRTQIDLRIEPYWGDRPVGAAGRKRDVIAFRNWLMDPANGYGKTYNFPTVQAAMRVFSAFCTWLAGTNGSLDANPCLSIKVADRDYVADPKGKRDPMSPVQIEKISKAFGELTRKVGGARGRKGTEQPLPEREVWMHRIVLYLLAYVGIRPEDIALACWNDVLDEDDGEFKSHMTVRRAKTDSGKKPRELFDSITDVLASTTGSAAHRTI